MKRGGVVPAAVEVRVLWLRTTCQEKKKERKEKRYQRNSSTHDPHFPRTVVENEDFVCM